MPQPLPPWLTWLETCDSTNTWALRHRDTLYHGHVIYSPHQTQGRGQYGRQWFSGGLTASFVLTAPRAIAAPSLIAGLAVIRAVESLMPQLQNQLQLKWPNDVMAKGKKLAGILCEGHQAWLVVGVGLNCWQPAEEHPLPHAISLQALGAAKITIPTVMDLVGAIRDELLWFWEDSRHWLHAANQRDFLRELPLTVTGGQTPSAPLWQGEGAGINAQGHLQLRLANGKIIAIASGHVIYSEKEISSHL